MDRYKKFLYDQRLQEVIEPYIIIGENITEKVYEIIAKMVTLKFEPDAYYKYYGVLKTKIDDFINYWSLVINGCVKIKDDMLHTVTKEDFLEIIHQSTAAQKSKQAQFDHYFLPIETPEQEEMYEEIIELFKKLEPNMQMLIDKLDELDTEVAFKGWCEYSFDLSIKKKNESFWFAHSYLATCLAQQTYRIQASLDDIVSRARNNLKELRARCVDIQAGLLEQLYDLNKDRNEISRREQDTVDRNTDLAEADLAIAKCRHKIDTVTQRMPLSVLEEELSFWEERYKSFSEIQAVILRIKSEIDKVEEYKAICNDIKQRSDQTKQTLACGDKLPDMVKRRLKYLNHYLTLAARTMMSFFTVRGTNRVFYEDDVGTYVIDEYGHQIYLFDSLQQSCHLDCDGNYVEFLPRDKYFYDEHGKYILNDSGDKVYQCGPCTSTYKLGEDGLLKKTSKDCGHSEKPNPYCRMQIRNPNDFMHLPMSEHVDIRGKLPLETTYYLWDLFGHILPEVLNIAFKRHSRNPIPDIGHCILNYCYMRYGKGSLEKQKQKATEYLRTKVKERNEKALAENLLWKSKQLKRQLVPDPGEDITVYYLRNKQREMTQFHAVNTAYDEMDSSRRVKRKVPSPTKLKFKD